jgi:hypothetical protein
MLSTRGQLEADFGVRDGPAGRAGEPEPRERMENDRGLTPRSMEEEK